MYETGLAHAIGKPIIMLTREQQDVPFDLRSLRYIFYDPNNPFWGEDLRTELTKLLRKVLESQTIGTYLAGIEVKTQLPIVPDHPIKKTKIQEFDFSGVWITSWLSISASRKHKATLVIPPNHGQYFIASMTVTYEKDGQQTIVQESLTGNASDSRLTLSGINYTYVEQGNSRSYSLDNFDLVKSDDGLELFGNAMLKNGIREVKFSRLDHAKR